MAEPATSIQSTWLADLPIWLQHLDKVPYYSFIPGSSKPFPRHGYLDTHKDRSRLVTFSGLRLSEGFEPGYALGPVGDKVLCGVDLDKCFDSDGKVLKPLKEFCAIARDAGAMIEVSRGGNGLHVVWLALPDQLPPTFKRPSIECYTGRRFFAWGKKIIELGGATPLDMRHAVALLPGPPLKTEPDEVEQDNITPAGGRNNWLRERLETLYRAGLRGDTLREALRNENERLADPLSAREVEQTVLQGVDKIQHLITVRPPSEVFTVVEDTAPKPSLARPLGDGADYDFDVVYHLIDNVLPLGGMTMLWGESTAGKSFLALDWSLHIVYGRAWHGHKVRPGRVLYMAGEGEIGLKKRVVAWRKHHGIAEPTGLQFAIHNLQHVTAFESLKLDRYDIPQCDLIVLDTLNRWSQGDENKADDMAAWLRVAQQLSDRAGGAAVLIVHHARKDGEIYRGSTAIKAAVDSEFEITGTPEAVSITHHKSKDEECIKPMTLMKRSVELGEKEDGFGGTRVHTSLVLTAPAPGETQTGEQALPLRVHLIKIMREMGGAVTSMNTLIEMAGRKRKLAMDEIRRMRSERVLVPDGRYGLKLVLFPSDDDIFN